MLYMSLQKLTVIVKEKEEAVSWIPNCKNCGTKAVEANAGVTNDIPFYVCRTCKIEVDWRGYEIKPKEETVIDGDFKIESDRFSLNFDGLEESLRRIKSGKIPYSTPKSPSVAKTMQVVYVDTATDEELDDIAELYGLKREPKETDTKLRERCLDVLGVRSV